MLQWRATPPPPSECTSTITRCSGDSGDAYITGLTNSTDFPLQSPYQSSNYAANYSGYFTGFVTKLNPAGSGLLYSTYLGGSWRDRPQGIAVDSAGEASVVG
jgi:hypothetical protein